MCVHECKIIEEVRVEEEALDFRGGKAKEWKAAAIEGLH